MATFFSCFPLPQSAIVAAPIPLTPIHIFTSIHFGLVLLLKEQTNKNPSFEFQPNTFLPSILQFISPFHPMPILPQQFPFPSIRWQYCQLKGQLWSRTSPINPSAPSIFSFQRKRICFKRPIMFGGRGQIHSFYLFVNVQNWNGTKLNPPLGNIFPFFLPRIFLNYFHFEQ